jgi:hypothetical protein
LHEDAKRSTCPQELARRYEQIDRLQTECMIHAESMCSKTYSLKYNWSPTLKATVNTV